MSSFLERRVQQQTCRAHTATVAGTVAALLLHWSVASISAAEARIYAIQPLRRCFRARQGQQTAQACGRASVHQAGEGGCPAGATPQQLPAVISSRATAQNGYQHTLLCVPEILCQGRWYADHPVYYCPGQPIMWLQLIDCRLCYS